MQLNVMSTRMVALLAPTPQDRALAGDQLYVDLDLGTGNLPAGTRLSIGSAVIEVTERPHNGCAKFRERFGEDAVRFVNSPAGKELRLRGLNARVIAPGVIRRGAAVTKL
jgi:MOSC domain-containing protein YiiM